MTEYWQKCWGQGHLYCIFPVSVHDIRTAHPTAIEIRLLIEKGAYIISRRPSHGQFEHRCCPQAFLRIFSEVTYIRTVGNSTLLKIYT
jgi:hypothetical protein